MCAPDPPALDALAGCGSCSVAAFIWNNLGHCLLKSALSTKIEDVPSHLGTVLCWIEGLERRDAPSVFLRSVKPKPRPMFVMPLRR